MYVITFMHIVPVFAFMLLLSGVFFGFYRKVQVKKQEQKAPLHTEVREIEEEVPATGARHYELFERLRTYLLTDRNFLKPEVDTNLLISELATNRTYLFEAVKLATGKTLQEYINTLRMEEARHLLATTNEVNEAIAVICGYSSVRTFYRLFRSHYSMSPTAYRKMIRQQKKYLERSVT